MNLRGPLPSCVNGCNKPVKAPSWVLCVECLDELGRKLKALADGFNPEKPAP